MLKIILHVIQVYGIVTIVYIPFLIFLIHPLEQNGILSI